MFFPPSITCIQMKETNEWLHGQQSSECSHSPIWQEHVNPTAVRNKNLTLQATSTFMGLPPNSVGGELDLGGAALACEDLADAAVSQRCRKRVTSSWSSIVFMCLMERKHERCKVETTTCLFERLKTRLWQKKRYFEITWTRHSTTSSS